MQARECLQPAWKIRHSQEMTSPSSSSESWQGTAMTYAQLLVWLNQMDTQSQLNVDNPKKKLLETLCCSISWIFPANPTALSPSSVSLKMGFNVVSPLCLQELTPVTCKVGFNSGFCLLTVHWRWCWINPSLKNLGITELPSGILQQPVLI